MGERLEAVPLTYGHAGGRILRLDEPISFWGGVSTEGIIVDRHHPQFGQSVVGRILAMTTSRGSSSGSFSLMELIRTHLAPAAFVLCEADGVTCTGVLAATETYGMLLPVVQVTEAELLLLPDGEDATVQSEPGAAHVEWVPQQRPLTA